MIPPPKAALTAPVSEALRLNPDYAEALACLGRVKACLGKEDEAISCLERALCLRPGYADLHRELADRYIANARYNEAIQELEKAIEQAPELFADEIQVNPRFTN